MSRKLFMPHLIVRKNEIHSTNSFATELMKSNNPSAGTVVLALNQTKGRGQHTNVWESEWGKNLTISIILMPDFLPIDQQFKISMIISLGVLDYLKIYLPNVFIKWPNDIYVQDDKIAGILIEHSVMGATLSQSICGIGLNINQEKFYSDAPNPTSLKLQTNKDYEIELELSKLLESIEARYFQLLDGKLNLLEENYLQSLYWINELHQFEDKNGSFTGEITGVTALGQLRIFVGEQERIYNFKEVSFIS